MASNHCPLHPHLVHNTSYLLRWLYVILSYFATPFKVQIIFADGASEVSGHSSKKPALSIELL